MRIAVDAMGGDNAPSEIVAGAIEAARQISGLDKLILVGDETAVNAELAKVGDVPALIEVLHASQIVEMHESPAHAVRKKKDSSIARAVELVKHGKADAVFSAGNTGAMVAASQMKLRTLAGVDRPAITTLMPTVDKPFVLLDAGANTDCTARMIAQFAVMGSVYSAKILGVENPRVGLLSIGEEDAKGNDVTKEAFKMLENSNLNFIGNVESSDMFEGRVDVVTCDGFVGNVVLKTSESVAKFYGKFLKISFTKSFFRKIGAAMLIGAFKEIKAKADPEVYGGAPLLGVNGICIIGHGSSSAFAVTNGIRVACKEHEIGLNQAISNGVEEVGLHHTESGS